MDDFWPDPFMILEFSILLTLLCLLCLGTVLWHRRHQRRLLNSRETAHLLRQAQYLLQLAHTTLQCGIDPAIAIALLRLADETLTQLAATGQPDARESIQMARERCLALEQRATARSAQQEGDGDPLDEEPSREPDYARIRLQLTDATRLLNRAFRRGFIDRAQHQRMTEQMERARLEADIDHLLQRQADACSAGDQARARACLSQARGRLVHLPETPQIRRLLDDIDHRLRELDRITPGSRSRTATLASPPPSRTLTPVAGERLTDG